MRTELKECSCFILLICLFSSAWGQNANCDGVFIMRQCQEIRLDSKSWPASEQQCNNYTVAGNRGAHLTVISSEAKQNGIRDLIQNRLGIPWVWLGGTTRPILWQWKSTTRTLQAQGCYFQKNNEFTYIPNNLNYKISIQECTDACFSYGFGFAAVQDGGFCRCGNIFTPSEQTGGCTTPCEVDSANFFGASCGGPGRNFVYKLGGAYARWATGEPNNPEGVRSCAVVDNSRGGFLADEPCNATFDFICQFDNRTGCPIAQNCQFIGRQFFLISTNYYTASSWPEASATCRSLGGELASLEGYNLQLAISYWINGMFGGRDKKLWVGAYKGGWTWLAGHSFEYTNWAPGQPTGGFDDTDLCLRINAAFNYSWEARPCSEAYFFFCQRDYEQMTTPANVWLGPAPTPWGNGTLTVTPPANVSEPSTGGSTGGGLSDVAIGLLAFLGALLLLLLLLLCLLLYCCCCKKKKTKKVDAERWHDARTIAHVPNSAEEHSNTVAMNKEDGASITEIITRSPEPKYRLERHPSMPIRIDS